VNSAPESVSAPPSALGRTTERRIAWLTLGFGFIAAVVAAALRQFPWAFGLVVGTMLAWLNFRLLRRGLDSFVEASKAQSESKKPQVPLTTYAAIALRYGLIAAVVYAIFELLRVPLLSMVVGLCALGAATIAASVYEILRPSSL
jgi:small-conductance mechanosensitive channel